MAPLVIGVSGLNAVDNPAPGVGVARSLKEDGGLDCRIVGLSYDAMEPGNYMDWLVDRSFIMPYPTSGFEAVLERLLYIKNSYGLDFLLPTLDAELPQYIKFAGELERNGIKTFLPTAEQFKLRGKDYLKPVAEAIGMTIPDTEVVTSYEQLIKAVDSIGLPVMVKGALYKAYRAYTTQEAISHFHAIVAEWGYPVIVQQVVTGEEMNVVGVGDGEGGSLGSVGIKKLSVTSLGKIWTGVTVKNEKMLAAAERFLHQYQWKSAFELECIISGNDIYLIEINPRFPAWSWFATGVGVNLAANLVRKGCGLPPLELNDYDAGKLYIRFTDELVTDMEPFRKMTTSGEK